MGLPNLAFFNAQIRIALLDRLERHKGTGKLKRFIPLPPNPNIVISLERARLMQFGYMRQFSFHELRWTAPAAAAVIALVFVILNIDDQKLYSLILRLFAVAPQKKLHSFIDLEYILASVECWQKGIDVYLTNPCDPLQRLYNYSPLLLRASFMPVKSWTNIVALGLISAFAMSLLWLPSPRHFREALMILFATVSPTVIFALERGNADVFIFISVLLAVSIMSVNSLKRRTLGYAIILFVGLLKFYPLILLGLSLRERVRICLIVVVASALILLFFVTQFYDELAKMTENLPSFSYFGPNFGAANLPGGFPIVAAVSPVLVWTVLIGLSVVQIVSLTSWTSFRHELAKLPPFENELLFCGSALISGCFIAGQNVGYRGIFLLFILPGLMTLWRYSSCLRVQRLVVFASLLVLLVMWQGLVTWSEFFSVRVMSRSNLFVSLWIIREFAWWWVASISMGVVLCFLAEAQSVKWMRRQCSRSLRFPLWVRDSKKQVELPPPR